MINFQSKSCIKIEFSANSEADHMGWSHHSVIDIKTGIIWEEAWKRKERKEKESGTVLTQGCWAFRGVAVNSLRMSGNAWTLHSSLYRGT